MKLYLLYINLLYHRFLQYSYPQRYMYTYTFETNNIISHMKHNYYASSLVKNTIDSLSVCYCSNLIVQWGSDEIEYGLCTILQPNHRFGKPTLQYRFDPSFRSSYVYGGSLPYIPCNSKIMDNFYSLSFRFLYFKNKNYAILDSLFIYYLKKFNLCP